MSADPFPDLELTPPADASGFTLNDWFVVPSDSPTALYIYHQLWDLPQRPALWQAARISRAIYLYREKATGWTVLVKFYREKVDEWWAAEQYAANEVDRIRQARALGLSDGAVRAVRALALHRDVLFLEHVDGLTLEDAIAVRRTRTGALQRILEDAAHLLARLHAGGRQPEAEPDLGFERWEAQKFIGDLAYAGVLQDNALVCDALRRLVDRWFSEPLMLAYTPTWIHGDATTSNFIIPTGGGMVAIDWERMRIADPASELGRLLAEVAHAVGRYGATATRQPRWSRSPARPISRRSRPSGRARPCCGGRGSTRRRARCAFPATAGSRARTATAWWRRRWRSWSEGAAPTKSRASRTPHSARARS